MTTYRLPDELGGREVEVLHGFARPDDRVDVRVPGVVGVITLDSASVLVVVPPPMPPEPPVGAYHIDHQLAVRDAGPGIARWYWCQDNGRSGYATWAVVWHHLGGDGVQVVPLVPAPEPVTLPWRAECATGDRATIRVEQRDHDGHIPVILSAGVAVYLTPSDARTGGNALLTAADEADRRVSDATP